MPSKKKKYNARFPAGRIKKIMQSDEEIGKVAQAVPVIISRTLELFVESLLTKTLKITNSRNAKTLSPSHMKQCIMAENRFDFLRELVKNIPDISVAEEAVSNDSSPEATTIDPSDMPYDLSMPSTSNINNNNNSNTETSFQKLNPTNGGGGALSLVRNNGVTRSCGTTVISNTFKSHQQPTLNNALNLGVSEENRDKLKRQWDVIGRSISQIQQDTTQHASTPPKLLRTDSAPAGIARTQHPSTTITSARAQQKNQQHHEQPNQQTLPTDLRRLRHQAKSVPGNHCTDKTTTTPVATAAESHTNLNKPQTPKTVIPAPIVSIDFCNKPVIKIDYSNLALHTNISDVNYSESLSSSSSSPIVVEQPNKSFIDKAVVKIQTPTITTTPESPVINIDLSNIVTSGTFTTSSLHPSVLSPVSLPTASPVASSAVTTNKNSYLELDEDYDNI
ncbi:mucin-2 [Episyrphus balteatus]|uniref:mucin-2 n=1 Tax=Episyrphus balteatus TaxID=286459 RepID=UPI0024859B5C|nr:mucin-2 [Episyrphus balteatus]